jgi:putative protease
MTKNESSHLFPELLAPAGNLSKLYTAIHFKADAVYFGGKNLGLRAFSDNFTNEEILSAFKFLHKKGKKGYVTLNIFPKNSDFEEIKDFLQFLNEAEADGVIISDSGVIDLCKKICPSLDVHLSTQANTLNKYAAKFWEREGVKRIVLARELSLKEISEIRQYLDKDTEIEVFVHGAMCISYSGRCLLSNYLNGRDSNRGECVQACRWEYDIKEHSREGGFLTIQQDGRGTYILNSKDLNLIRRLEELTRAGVNSFKIEGRMKSEYYIGTVVNSYVRALEDIKQGRPFNENLYEELYKTGHREYTEAFYEGQGKSGTVNLKSSSAVSDYEFIASVLGFDNEKGLKIMQRNRFYKGDVLEALSAGENHNKIIKADYITDEEGNEITDAKLVQQILYIRTDVRLEEYDMLRKKKEKPTNAEI